MPPIPSASSIPNRTENLSSAPNQMFNHTGYSSCNCWPTLRNEIAQLQQQVMTMRMRFDCERQITTYQINLAHLQQLNWMSQQMKQIMGLLESQLQTNSQVLQQQVNQPRPPQSLSPVVIPIPRRVRVHPPNVQARAVEEESKAPKRRHAAIEDVFPLPPLVRPPILNAIVLDTPSSHFSSSSSASSSAESTSVNQNLPNEAPSPLTLESPNKRMRLYQRD